MKGEASMKKALLALLVAAGVTSISAPSSAQEKIINLKVSLWVPPAHPLVPATQAWIADIEKASGGTIKPTLFPSEQLGKAFDHYDMARDGIAEVTLVSPGYQPGRFPIAAAAQIPFVFGDARKGTLAFDEWYRKYAPTEMKDTKLCLAFVQDPGTLHSKKKIVLPSDLSGLKVRPAQSGVAEMIKLLGGANVQASAPESRDALERGVADALAFPWGSLFLFGIDKAVKYHIDVALYTQVFTFNINPRVYNSMSEAQKKVLDDHCSPEWSMKISEPSTEFEINGRTRMKALADHEIYKLTDDQLAQWKKVVEPLHESWAEAVKKVGSDPAQIDADLQAAIKKYNAGI
jgi:TRAP-type C4-dicarboxylate transport system substrate-binding protein